MLSKHAKSANVTCCDMNSISLVKDLFFKSNFTQQISYMLIIKLYKNRKQYNTSKSEIRSQKTANWGK